MKVNKFLICLVLAFVTSCGTIQSTGAIVKADRAKEAALKKIVDVSKDDTLLERDSFGNETLSGRPAEKPRTFFLQKPTCIRQEIFTEKASTNRLEILQSGPGDFS